MKWIPLASGELVPALGLGTWRMGEDPATRTSEVTAIREALDLGITLIDMAEMYGEGRAEELVAEAIQGRRDKLFLVSKVYPQNASRRGTVAACERSLRRLATDRIDLYLLHWRGETPLSETLDAFIALRQAGKIRHFGVSNFDIADMAEAWELPGGPAIAANQVLYNLVRRGIEWDLLPWLRERLIPVIAYSPVEQGKLIREPKLIEFARGHGMTPAQVALSWLLAQDGVIAIPKSSDPERWRENMAALEHPLGQAELAELDLRFPPPTARTELQML